MKIFVKFDFNTLAKRVLEDQFGSLGAKYRMLNFGEIEFLEPPRKQMLEEMEKRFANYGIEIIENQKTALVQKIKDAITAMVFSDEQINVKSSVYLSEKLGHSYGYLSNIFSEVTYSSVENFIILQKIEYAKQLLIVSQLSLTEIANKLNYSSVAHLSTQFKNTTGITPTQFQKIIRKRREIAIKK